MSSAEIRRKGVVRQLVRYWPGIGNQVASLGPEVGTLPTQLSSAEAAAGRLIAETLHASFR